MRLLGKARTKVPIPLTRLIPAGIANRFKSPQAGKVVAVEIALNHDHTVSPASWRRGRFEGLTGRQSEILRAVVWGMSADDIAQWLKISPRTVELHRSQALARIGARNVADAVRIAITQGFDFQPDPRAERPERAGFSAGSAYALDPREAVDLQASLERHFDHDGLGPLNNGASASVRNEEDAQASLMDGAPLVRVIGLPGRTFDKRVHWVAEWANVEREMTYSPWSAGLLAQAGTRFDVVLVHGDEDRRVAHLLREFREVYPSKLMIAVLSHARAAERSLLYRAGADSVFDLFSEGEVAQAWLANAIRRQEDFTATPAKAAAHSRLVAMLGSHSFTRAEVEFVNLLEQSAGRPVSYAALAQLTRRTTTRNPRKSIQVLICRLNVKLAGLLKIRNVRDEGYQIDSDALEIAIERLSAMRTPIEADPVPALAALAG